MMQSAVPVNMNAFTPFTSGGAVYYTAPQNMPQHSSGFQQPTQNPVCAISGDCTDLSFSPSKHVTRECLDAVFSMNRNYTIPEGKLSALVAILQHGTSGWGS